MADLGTIQCDGKYHGDITDEIIARVKKRCLPQHAMAQVTLDGISREHGKGIDMRDLAGIREQLLDLKIRVKEKGEESLAPLQQDIRMVDYLQEFGAFVGKQQISAKQKEFALTRGREVLQSVMEEHRGTVE
jgi:hypothetical protein